jgi:aldose 1-epimerase
MDQYTKQKLPYVGSTVGRYCNRIKAGEFILNDVKYTLAKNNNGNSLHGGDMGFDKKVWDTESASGDSVTFALTSEDMEEGYPGTVRATVTFSVAGDTLSISYSATTDKETIVNLTNHSYFNLRGHKDLGTICDHEVQLFCDKFIPIDKVSIPTGEVADVEGTPFDFRTPTTVGARLEDDHEQLKNGSGYDHNFCINGDMGTLRPCAVVVDPLSGRKLECSTTEPGVQFYSGNFLAGNFEGKGGLKYPKRSGFCMETQHYPDSPNNPEFPSTVLAPGATYTSQTQYRFTVQ